MKRTIKVLAAALLLAGVVSCQEKESNEPQVEIKPIIEFVNSSDASIILPAGSTESFDIQFKSTFPLASMTIEATEGGDWCSAEFQEGDIIKVSPTETGILELKKAVFTIKMKEGSEPAAEEVEFRITRSAAELQQKNAITFTDLENREVKIATGSAEPVFVQFRANFDLEGLEIRQTSGNDWITAAFEGEDQIRLTPSADFMMEVKNASFVVGAKASTKAAIIYEPRDVEFKVVRSKMILMDEDVVTIHGFGEEINIGPNKTEPYPVSMTYNFPKEEVSIENVSGGDWCSAELTESGFNILPSSTGTDQALYAKFVIKGSNNKTEGNFIYQPKNVEFTVFRPRYIKEFIVTLSGTNVTENSPKNYSTWILKEGGSIELKVNTNSPTWYYKEIEDVPWCTPSKEHGDDGDILTLTITANNEGTSRFANVLFTTLPWEETGTLLQIQQAN